MVSESARCECDAQRSPIAKQAAITESAITMNDVGRVEGGGRLPVLDGLRGWGALFVLFYHVFSSGLRITPESGEFLRHLLPFNGPYAVMIFFVVSGVSLSVGYLGRFDNGILIKSAAARYFRLAIPILAVSLSVHVSMILGLLSPSADRLAPFANTLNFETSIAHVLRFSLYDVFFKYSPHWTYAGPLWTMSVELIGSFLLFAVLFTAVRTRHALLVISLVAVLMIAMADTETLLLYSLFLLGAVIAGAIQRRWIQRIPPALSITLLVIGIAAPAILHPAFDRWNIAATVALTVGCMASRPANLMLSCSLSRKLGEISFPLYLVHGPVMVFVGEPLVRNFGDSVPSKIAINLGVIFLSLIAALPMVSVNKVAIKVARGVGDYAASIASTLQGRIRRSARA